MKRNLYLQGELADKFGPVLVVDVSTLRDVFKLLEANYPEFRGYMLAAKEQGRHYEVAVVDDILHSEKDLVRPLKGGDIYFGPSLAGAGGKVKAVLKIAAAVVIGFFAITTGQFQLLGLAINLFNSGMQDLMSPDPDTDESEPQSYLFNGSEQNIIEGDPVPVLYGELRVPGRPISLSIVSGSAGISTGIAKNNNVTEDADGNINIERVPGTDFSQQ